uniref:NADH-ubiquinone oxidoreductase chain 6 n=1 Tax=Prismognathus prossi TaxID=618395 RepID=A0A5C1VA56_9SCAR|nr:NADH dehydrogenase subunit 6 [Prismognathus prossi]QEN73232.1 NADH dehydrogenase subunit 6 [Prismognathus prossi]
MLTIIPPMMIPFMKHPLSLGALLLLQTILIALTVSTFTLTFWFSYIMFLIMVGGMLVLFMYMTSVASNEKFQFSWKTWLILALTIGILTKIKISNTWNYHLININSENINNLKIFIMSLSKFINLPLISISMSLIIYLLITLIAAIKIIDIKHGPIRHKN